MKHKILVICCILSGILLYGCPPPKTDLITSEQGDCGVSDLQVDVNDKMMNISWKNGCDKNIAGYYVYVSENSNESKPFNHTPFDGDTNPEDGIENFEATHLENGKKYFVSVKIVNPDQSLSKGSSEIVAVCGLREEIELSIRYKSEHDGYSFKQNQYVSADNDANDFYFYSKDGKDYLASPHKLDGYLRKNQLTTINYNGDFQELRKNIEKYNANKYTDKLAISKGNWVQIKTAENNYALVKVLSLSGSGTDRKVKLFVAYSTLQNERIF